MNIEKRTRTMPASRTMLLLPITWLVVGTLAIPASARMVMPDSDLPSFPEIPLLPSLLPPGLGVSGEIDAPEYVYAGEPFTVVVELRLDLPGASVVQALPIAVVGPCTMTEYTVSGGVPLGGGYYLLTSGLALAPLIDTTGDPVEFANTLDVHMTWDTAEDILGTCQPGESFIELVDQVTGGTAKILSKLIPVLELPATPIVLGTVTTSGGNDIEDQATVTTPALPQPPAKLPILVLTSNPKVALKGGIVHSEIGPTWSDDGYFEIRENGINVNHEKLTQNGDSKFLEAERSLPHAKGQTIDTTYCLYGVYRDDGWWEDEEGPVETCVIVAATEPADPLLVDVLGEACFVFRLPSTQLDLLLYEFVLEPRLLSVPSALVGGPEAVTSYFMFDRDFGHLCA